MATLKEIMAAKKAAQAQKQASAPSPSATPAAAAAPANAGNAVGVAAPPERKIPLRNEPTTPLSRPTMETEAEAELLAANPPRPMASRALCESQPDVPFVFRSPKDSAELSQWKAALLCPETQLGILLDGDHAWIAVTPREGNLPEAFLIHRLPILSRMHEGAPF